MTQLDLHLAKPRETSGSSTTSRFRFQANLAIMAACDMHLEGDEYAVLVEHFDDITLVRPNAERPLTFVQVKGKVSGNWTISQLTKVDPKKPAPNSVLGKLYSNVPIFPDQTDSIEFVSNATFNLQLADGSKGPSDLTEIGGAQLHTIELSKIASALEPDFPSPRTPECKDLLKLRRTSLDVSDDHTFVVGKLTELSEKLGLSGVPTSALYKTLFAEVQARSAKVVICGDTDELLKAKGIRRADVQALLEASATVPRFEEFVPILTADLQAEEMRPIKILRLIKQCREFIANRSLGRTAENLLSENFSQAINDNPEPIETSQSIIQAANKYVAELENIDLPSELKLAAALVAISEHLNG